MPMITIDDVEYDLELMSDQVKAQIGSLQAVDRRMALLQEEQAILQTARSAYAAALKRLLSSEGMEDGANTQIQWPH